MNEDFKKLPLVIDGKAVIFPCVEIMALSTTPKVDGAAGYVRFYEAFARRYGDRLQHYRLSDSTRWKRFLPKDEDKVASWFSDARTLKDPLLGIVMHTQAKADDPQPPLFEMFFDHVYPERPRGMFRIALPITDALEDTSELLALVDDAMAELPVHWGTAGFAFYWKDTDTTTDEYANQWLGRHLLKHPGLATGDLMAWGVGVERGIANIGWLTFVGDALVDALGGRPELAKRLAGTGVTLRSYAHGVALQAGPVPELGDVNRKRELPLHRVVGRVLEPVFVDDDRLQLVDVTGLRNLDQRTAWLRRFLP